MIQTILDFWFNELSPAQWWRKDPSLDQQITTRFSSIHHQASRRQLAHWRQTAAGCLAEIIILDQFSRNIYRDQPKAYANDDLALLLAEHAVSIGIDQQLSQVQRSFLYMPYMHSESQAMQQMSVALYQDSNLELNINSALQHKAIIDQFGRFPHRNQILNRTSTKAEIEFLRQPNSGF